MDESVMKSLSLKRPKLDSNLPLPTPRTIEDSIPETGVEEEEDIGDWCMILAGNAIIDKNHIIGEGEFIFSTLLVYIQKQLSTPRNILSIYYEVEILSKGIIQLGWATSAFQSQFSNDIAHDNGVGDDVNSFAYDGCRGLKWNANESLYGRKWSKGDVVGCEVKYTVEEDGVLEKQAKCDLVYYLNGVSLGTAFSTNTHLTYDKELNLFTYEVLTPAISLDGGEEIILNLGQSQFKHAQAVLTEEFYPVKDLLIQSFDNVEDRSSSIKPQSSITMNDGIHSSTSSDQRASQLSVEPKSLDLFSASPQTFAPLDLEDARYDPSNVSKESALAALESLGLDYLKHELTRRGLKCGGTLSERAARLLSVRGLSWEAIDDKLKASSKQ